MPHNFFLGHYLNELHYSTFARTIAFKGESDKKKVLFDLFGSRNVIASADFPSHLQTYINTIPPFYNLSPINILDDWSLLPVFYPFLTEERLNFVQNDLITSNGMRTHMMLGIMASQISMPEYFRYCPKCAQEDRITVGETYWHREHQFPGVMVCHKHRIELSTSEVPIRKRKTRHEYICAEKIVPQIEENSYGNRVDDPLLIFIASEVSWLLSNPQEPLGPQNLYDKYRRLLEKNNLIKGANSINFSELLDRFQTSYCTVTLERISPCLTRFSGENWIIRLLRNRSQIIHPLKHILMLKLLGTTCKEFLSHDLGMVITMPGWPCLNFKCEHFGKPVIHSFVEKFYEKRFRRIFTCECGYGYSRYKDNDQFEDPFYKDRVETYGHVWIDALRDRYENGTTVINQLAIEFSVDPKTIKRYLRVGISSRPDETSPTQLSLHEKRQKFLQLKENFPDKGIAFLRKQDPALWSWLYRNDIHWLQSIKPPKVVNYVNDRVDWLVRDDELFDRIVGIKDEFYNYTNLKPERISVTSIGRKLGILAILEQHIDKLPKTNHLIQSIVESRIDFAKRKIRWALFKLHRNNETVKEWKVVRLAGVGRLVKNDECKLQIEAEIRKLIYEI
jgi:hypothetical protein